MRETGWRHVLLLRCLTLSVPCLAISGVARNLAAAESASVESPLWQIDTSLSYLTGDYGEAETTDMVYWPVVGKRFFPWGEVSLTVPYIHIKSPGGQVILDGAPEFVGASGTGRETASGLGDVIVKGKYAVRQQEGPWPWVDAVARVKLPTADDDKGLGTGEMDVGLGVELVRAIDYRRVAFFDLGYTFIGEPAGSDFENRWTVSPGFGCYVRPELLLAGFYEWREAISPTADDSHALSVLAYAKARPDLRVYAMFDYGLSDGAPDVGLTAGVGWRF